MSTTVNPANVAGEIALIAQLAQSVIAATPSNADERQLDLWSEANLFARFEHDVQLAGLVGEHKNAKVVLLAGVSAKLRKPLNVSVGGASSAGKNHLLGIVARFMPDENKIFLTGMSPKALMHSDENEFQNKAVFIAEYEGVSGADYAVRTMQSEQVIEWDFVEASTQGLKKKKKRVKGPAAFIQATTRTTLHPENETRLLFTQMDESEAQTRAVTSRQALEAEGKIPACPPNLYSQWHEFLRSLDSCAVRIPFARQLAKYLPADRIRSRRDFPKLLGLIEVSAFLHQHQRNRDTDGAIVAAPPDYLVAKELFEHCYNAGPDRKVGELLQAAGNLGKAVFSVADLITATGWGKSKTYEVHSRAEELGCIVEVVRGSYRLLRTHAELPLTLPPEIEVTADDFRISTEIPPSPGPGEFPNFHSSTEGTPEDFGISTIPLQEEGESPGGKAENRVPGKAGSEP